MNSERPGGLEYLIFPLASRLISLLGLSGHCGFDNFNGDLITGRLARRSKCHLYK